MLKILSRAVEVKIGA